ncbi:MAG: type II toxin-antitoxin system HicA family toxin [Acidobacteriota bacterium]
MPKTPRWNGVEAESALLKAGFVKVRTKGSHRIYMKASRRVVVPHHGSAILHPKIVRQVPEAIEETS